MIQAGDRVGGLERAHFPEHLSAVIPRHPDRSNLPRSLVHIKVRRAAHIQTTVAQIHRALSVARKLPEEFLSGFNRLKRLPACAGNPASYPNVVVLAEHAAERVTRERARLG